MIPSIFSNADYYKNVHFQRCMRNWNIYIMSDGESDELLAEWEEVCLKDFLQHSREWLKENWNDIFWRNDKELR